MIECPNSQKNNKDNLLSSRKDTESMTHSFIKDNCIGEGRYWKQYEGEIPHANANGCTTVVAKHFDSKCDQGCQQFLRELKAHFEYKHENIVSLVGYCNDMDYKIIIYQHAPNRSLDNHVNNASLTWMKRLNMCIDVANGLKFLHKETVIHRDIKSASVVIDGNWKAKISNLELTGFWQRDDYKHDTSSLSYMDPLVKEHDYFTAKSDVYSLGVVLIEILSGRLAKTFEESAGDLVQKCKGSAEAFDALVFKDIKKQSAPQSLTTFFEIAGKCLELEYANRPDAGEVVTQLAKALELQEDYELWEPRLPKDYEEIFNMSNTREIFSNKTKKDLYDMLTKGILLQQGKLWFVFGGNGERNEMISATKFSYRNWCPHSWQSLPESRFRKVAEMSDISNLMIKIKTRPRFLTPNTVYGVHLVFKFCDSRNFSSKPTYVNLKYRKGNETLHTYFATWRDDKWMMIELYRFVNQKEDAIFKFLLESLSPRYPGDDAIYVEGIEFRAINNVEHEEFVKLKEVHHVLKSNSNVVQVQQLSVKGEEIFKRSQNYDNGEKLFLSEVNGKNHLMLSAKEVLYNFSDLKLFNSKPSAESRFQEVIELLPQPVFRINCTIKSQMLSQDTEYACYLVFKLSANCQGLHCPVEVQDLLHRDNKDVELVYFKSPSPWNIHDITRVPTQREDGWMEVNVWKFNSQHEVKNNRIPVKLKLISYEGTMPGLIVCGLEFRPV